MTDTLNHLGGMANAMAPPRFFDRLHANAKARPNATAIIEGPITLTNARLLDAVDGAAKRWRERQCGPGVRVGVLSRRSLSTVVEILGVLAAGGAYVPLDRSAPLARLRFQIDDASLAGVVTEADEDHRWSAMVGSTRTWNVPRFMAPAEPRDWSVSRVDTPVDPSTLAYVIFTSGSTGVPKGVGISRSNLDALLDAWDRVMGPVRHVSLLASALSFDASVAELFWPLAAGGRLVVASDGPPHHRGGAGFSLAFGRLIRDRRVTHMQCTPTRAALMLADADDRAALARLDHLVIGGEALTASLARELLSTGVRRLTNAYGPTECTVWASTHDVTGDDLPSGGDDQPLPVGLPLSRTMLDVVDASGVSVGGGVAGELLIGGPLVAGGYVGRPELTAERFVDHPFVPGSASPAYRTGDVAWKRADGRIVVSGRYDHQVKVRGHRVELGEIEAALMAQPGVRLGLAGVVERHGRPCVVAAVVDERAVGSKSSSASEVASSSPSEVANPDTGCTDLLALRRVLTSRLPEVMVPELIVSLPTFPMLTSGKIDRPELLAMLSAAVKAHDQTIIDQLARLDVDSSDGDRRQNTELREMVTDFATVLGRGGVSPDSDFFLLGGHSLAAVELVRRIEVRTGQRLSIRALLSAGTPAAMVAWQANGPERMDRVLVRLTGASPSSGPARTLFLIHGAGGNVLRFRSLAHAVRDAVCVVGVQAPAAEGGQLDVSVRAMVQRYTDAMIESDPIGVYEIGGYSSGAILALLVAEELIKRGCRVRSLVLIDPVDSNVLARGVLGRLRAVRENVAPLDGISRRQRLLAGIEGWRRRREWDEEGSKALREVGYADLFAHIADITGRASVGSVDAPALVIRSSVENPFRFRRYTRAESAPRSARNVWIRAKHDELLHAGSIPRIAEVIEDFLRTV